LYKHVVKKRQKSQKLANLKISSQETAQKSVNYQTIAIFFLFNYLGASPAVPKTSTKGKLQQAVGGRAFRGYAIAPVLCSLLRRHLAS